MVDEKLRILYCVNSLAAKGGMEKVTIVKANAFAEYPDIEVGICFTDRGNFPEDLIHPLSPKIKIFDLNTPYWPLVGFKKILKSFIPTFFKTRKELKKVIKDFKPNVLISTGSYEKYAVSSISHNKLKSLVLGGGNVLKIREFHFNSDYRRFIGIKKPIAFILEFIENNLLSKGFDKSFLLTKSDYLNNYKNNKRFDWMYNPSCISIPQETNRAKEKIVLAVGRLAYQKNFNELIEIWATLVKDFPKWKLRIVGEGGDRNKLQKLIEDLKLTRNVELPGFSMKIAIEMSKASIYAMTSHYEGMPLVLLEAASQGLPIVSYDLPYGPSEIISNGVDGLLVPYKDKLEFSKALRKLMSNDDLRISFGENAQFNSKKFSISNICNCWIQKYKTLLATI